MRQLWIVALVGCAPQALVDEGMDLDVILPSAEDEPGELPEVADKLLRGFHDAQVLPAGLEGPGWVTHARGLRVAMGTERVGLRPASDAWSLRFSVAGTGRGDELQPVEPAVTHVRGTGLARVRGDVVEWYRNRPEGLEQGFSLRHAPAGTGPAVVALALDSSLQPVVVGSGSAVALRDESGASRLQWTKLVVYDADDVELPAWFEVDGCGAEAPDCHLRIAFDDSDARWPVTIDPLLTIPQATVSGFDAPGHAGSAVAVSGDWMAVGVPGPPGSTDPAAHVDVFARNFPTRDRWGLVQRIEGDATFGTAVAMEYPWLAVGEPRGAGRVILYRHDGTSWIEDQILPSPQPAAAFGTALALSDDTVYIGAPAWAGAGSVVAYWRHEVLGGGEWGEIGRFFESPSVPGGRMGEAVAASAGVVFAGAPEGGSGGRAYAYKRVASPGILDPDFVELGALTPSSGSAGDRFGAALAAAPRRAVVAAPGGFGEVFVFEPSAAGAWVQAQQISPPPGLGTGFGSALAADTRAIAVSDKSGGSERVHIYETGGSGAAGLGHVQVETLGVSGSVPGALALDGGALAAGEPYTGNGAVQVFRRTGTRWAGEELPTVALGLLPGSKLGTSVAFDGRELAVGIPRWSGTFEQEGAVAVFEYGGTPGSWTIVDLITSDAPEAYDRHGSQVDIAAGRVIAGGTGAVELYRRAGAGYETEPSFGFGMGWNGLGDSVALNLNYAFIGSSLETRDFLTSLAFNWVSTHALITPETYAGRIAAMDDGRLAILEEDPGDVRSVAMWSMEAGPSPHGNPMRIQTLTAGIAGRDLFALELDGDHLFVGLGAEVGFDRGKIQVWRQDAAGGLWSLQNEILNPSSAALLPNFGQTAAVDGDHLYAGDVSERHVAVLEKNRGGADAWGHAGNITPPVPMVTADSFGGAIAARDGVVIVGAPGFNSNTGAVYVYYRDEAFAPLGRRDNYGTFEDMDVDASNPASGVLWNDEDANGDAITAVLDTPPPLAHGLLTRFDPDGTFIFRPEPDWFGTTTFTYTATDGSLSSGPVTVQIDVTSVPDDPVAVPDPGYGVDEDGFLAQDAAGGVLANDTDADGDLDRAELSVGATDGTVILQADGSFTYQPDPDFFGTDRFEYQAVDALGARSAAVEATITVAAVPDPPAPQPDSYTVDEDDTLTVSALLGVLANDTDADGDPLEARNPTLPTHGTLALQLDGSFVYTPDPDYSGPDGFTYDAHDGSLSTGPVVVTIDVTPVPDPPVAAPDPGYAVDEDGFLTQGVAGGVLANDSDPDGDLDRAELTLDVSNGTLALQPDGSFTYQPDPHWFGIDRFEYEAVDALGARSAAVEATITVASVPDAPAPLPDSYSVNEDDTLTVTALLGVLANDTDADGDPLEARTPTLPLHGSLVLQLDGSFVYQPDPDYAGPDGFAYHAFDGALSTGPVAVTLDVLPVPDAPNTTPALLETDEDVELVSGAPGVLAFASDPEGDAMTLEVLSLPATGTLVWDPTGAFRYTPAPDASGDVVFTWRACDPVDCSADTGGVFRVLPVNDPPVAAPDSYALDEDGQLDVTALNGVLRNDSDVDHPPNELTPQVQTGPAAGTLALQPTGAFSYTPDPDANGTDGFTYVVSDGDGALSNTVTVTLDVRPINDPPVAMDDTYDILDAVHTEPPATGVLANDSDVDGDALQAAVLTAPTHGGLVLAPTGGFQYTPDPGYSGDDQFTYTASDPSGASATASVRLVVGGSPVATGTTGGTGHTGGTTPPGDTGDTGGTGGTDDTACTASTWYPDADGDGYGDDAGAVQACAPPSGFVDIGGDCDDGDADAQQDCDGDAEPTEGSCGCASGAPVSGLWLGVVGLALVRRRSTRRGPAA